MSQKTEHRTAMMYRLPRRILLLTVVLALTLAWGVVFGRAHAEEGSVVTVSAKGTTTRFLVAESVSKESILKDLTGTVKSGNKKIYSVQLDPKAEISVTPITDQTAAMFSSKEESLKVIAASRVADQILADRLIDVTTMEKSVSNKTVQNKTIVNTSKKYRKTTKTVVRAGHPGNRRTTTTVKRVNGTKVSASTSVVITRKPVNRIVVKGTGSVAVKKGKRYGGTSGTEIINYAKKFVGNPYRYGGTSLTHGADCSGFVYSVYRHFGLNVPRVGQKNVGVRVPLSKLKPGDIVTFSGHVALYAGGGKLVHAVNARKGIRVTKMNYSGKRPLAATRIVL